ncbi:hypothetical protein SDC9_73141 [bioreactor metagenome]|uniref:Uncharacterized protein n=1 Tax=bioreactor metagenome TaxID=1076179 RepID=A0A644YEH9_9ZZZZ
MIRIEEPPIVDIAERANVSAQADGGGDQLDEVNGADGDDIEQRKIVDAQHNFQQNVMQIHQATPFLLRSACLSSANWSISCA